MDRAQTTAVTAIDAAKGFIPRERSAVPEHLAVTNCHREIQVHEIVEVKFPFVLGAFGGQGIPEV